MTGTGLSHLGAWGLLGLSIGSLVQSQPCPAPRLCVVHTWPLRHPRCCLTAWQGLCLHCQCSQPPASDQSTLAENPRGRQPFLATFLFSGVCMLHHPYSWGQCMWLEGVGGGERRRLHLQLALLLWVCCPCFSAHEGSAEKAPLTSAVPQVLEL